MENNYVLVYEINAERVLYVPQSVFNLMFTVGLSDNSCYYRNNRHTSEDELRIEWSEFSEKYQFLINS